MKFLIIFFKELADTLRDRRTLFSGFAYGLLGPVAIAFMVNMVAASSRDDALQSVALCGKGAAPGLLQHLTAAGITFASDGKVCLNVPANYAERMAQGRPAHLVISADLTANGQTARKLETEIKSYGSSLAAQRLIARGVAPSVTSPIEVQSQSSNAVSRQADTIARILIIFFVCAPFFVSLAAAADMTAGERERRSLEPLLSEPIGAFEIVFGKWLVAAGVGMVGTSLCVVAGLLLLERSALPELGVRLESGLPTALAVALMLAPLCGLVAAAQLAIGLYAKSFKDAQSYLTLFSFTPIVAGFATTGTPWAYAGSVPITWELTALGQPLLNAPPQGLPFTTMALIELALTLVVLGLAARRLGSEEILNSA